MDNDGMVYDTQRWDLMVGETIKEIGTVGSRNDIQRWDMIAGDTMYRDGK